MLLHHGSGLARLKEDLYRFKEDNLNGEIAFDQTLVVTNNDWIGATKAAVTVSERLIELELNNHCVPASIGLDYWQSWYDSGFSSVALLWIRPRIFRGYGHIIQSLKQRQLPNVLSIPHTNIDFTDCRRFMFSLAKWISLHFKRARLLFTRPVLAEIDTEREKSFKLQRESAERVGALLLNSWGSDSEFSYEHIAKESLSIMAGAYGVTMASAADSPDDVVKELQRVLDCAVAAKPNLDIVPPLWQRWWPAGIVALYGGLTVLGNWQSILEWFETSVVDTARAFVTNWVVAPMQTVYQTIRHDPNSTVALMGKQSLMSDLDSLERMVADFVLQQDSSASPAELEVVKEAARQGDLTPVLRVYEKQIQSPITSLITGGLLRTMTIQIQKAKVDAEITVAGIDKMLQSQQLVFGLIALLPGLFVVQHVFTYLKTMFLGRSQQRKVFASKVTKERLMVRLGNIEGIASNGDRLHATEVGLVYAEVTLLKAESKGLLSVRRYRQFKADLDRLVGVTDPSDIRDRLLMLYAKAAALESSSSDNSSLF